MFKAIRITVLLIILSSVLITFMIQRNVARDWTRALDIRLIPVISDQKTSTERFVSTLKLSDFENINRYLITQAKRFNVDLEYRLNLQLKSPITDIPPATPSPNTHV